MPRTQTVGRDKQGMTNCRGSVDWAVVFPSELGWMAAGYHGDLLVRLTFGHCSADAARADSWIQGRDVVDLWSAETKEMVQHLQAFAEGEAVDFSDIRLELSHHTRFQQRVLKQCRRIRWGWTLTYGQLAADAGSPRAARAVGNIMANNVLPLIIPCHRVVGAAGALGGFSAPGGLRMKRRLLELEAEEL